MSLLFRCLVLTLGCLFMLTTQAYADTNCQAIYGGGSICQSSSTLALQKQVLNPHTNAYVHDLGLVDNKFMPGDKVTFSLTVTNTGSVNATNVAIVDTLPEHMIYLSSSIDTNGVPDPSFTIGNLGPGQSQTVIMTVQLDVGNQLGNTGSICLINRAKAVGDNVTPAFDSSQMCIFHPQTFAAPSAVTTPATPGTGPSALSYLLIPSTGIAGLFLKKLANKKGGKTQI